MSIQQSLNQTLYQAGIMKGLYAQSEEGKHKAEVKLAEKNVKKAEAAKEVFKDTYINRGAKTPEEAKEKVFSEEFETSLGELRDKEVSAKRKLWELDPTSAKYDAYEKAKKSTEKYQMEKARYKEEKEIRKKLLEGTAEVPTKRTKIMEV